MYKENTKAIQFCCFVYKCVCLCVCVRVCAQVHMCIQVGGGGAESATASKLVSFPYGSLGKKIYSGEEFLLPNMKTTIIGYWKQWALLHVYGSCHWSIQWIQLHYFILQMYMSKQSINIMFNGNQCHDSLTKKVKWPERFWYSITQKPGSDKPGWNLDVWRVFQPFWVW